MASVTRSKSGDGEHRWFLGTLATIKISGEAVDGRYALIEFVFPHGASPPVHTHPQDERYVVLDGDALRPAPDELARIFAAHGQVNSGPPLGPGD